MDKVKSKRYALVMDVGGTNVVTAVVDNLGKVSPPHPKPNLINSLGNRDYIINKIASELIAAKKQSGHHNIIGVGISFPGTFDHKRGMVVIENPRKKTKYSSLYNFKFREILLEKLKVPVFFANDADAFALGESWIGAGRHYRRVLGITLGTGIGSGFIIKDNIITSGDGVPPRGELWKLKFRQSIVADYFESSYSIKRYLVLRKKQGYATKQTSLKQIASRASKGDEEARETFRQLGELLGEATASTVNSFRPNVIICGGQVSKSFSFFSRQFMHTLTQLTHTNTKILQAQLGDKSALCGMAKLVFNNLDS